MKQLQCPECGAPMWEGGRCPWDRGSGCVGRSLVVSKPARIAYARRVADADPKPKPVRTPAPRRRPLTAAPAKVASVSAPKPRAAARPQRPRLAPGEARARKIARSAAYNAAHRTTVIARCVWDDKVIEVHHGGPARKYCSPRCRGRAERAARAAA